MRIEGWLGEPLHNNSTEPTGAERGAFEIAGGCGRLSLRGCP
jgi:hypothetical protein